MKRSRRSGRDENGLVLILTAVAMTVIVAFVALVVDLAQLRTDRRVNKSVADMSVLAGLGVLNLGPWSGVCRASAYLKANSPAFETFDAGSEKWFRLGAPLSQLTSSPCLDTGNAPFVDLCFAAALGVPNPSTWGRLTATAGGGRFTIEIQSGYLMPDARFPEDLLVPTDTGDPLDGACDNLVVVIKERRPPAFAGVFGAGARTTTIRSVGRISNLVSEEYSPALLLLEREGCNLLEVTGSNSRVFAQPYLQYPGVIQLDSDNRDGCSSNQAVLNGAATSDGPAIVVCSAATATPTEGCNLALSDKPARIGMYALNFQPPGSHATTSFPDSYGDTAAVRGARSGREPLDRVYRENIVALDAEANSVLTVANGRPPGCPPVTSNACTDSVGRKWLVLGTNDCNNHTSFFSALSVDLDFPTGRPLAQNIWFGCDLNVNAPLVLAGLDSYVVITGKLEVSATFDIVDPRTVFVGGTASGNDIGLSVTNGGNFNLNNPVAGVDCLVLPPVVKATRMVVGKGSFDVGSGGIVHLCHTFAFLANGYGKVPATDGTEPCSSPCNSYKGKIDVGSGGVVDWIAPNQITGRRPTAEEILDTTRYEDLGLWTEAGGAQSMSGGGSGHMTGVFF
ncbi:MAG TPA: Tad domain-containing protein, partial [Acidimicrobiales bacterium]|nr:Tad domain-containing protein [Acidimicrobiales bacterium]